MEVRCVGTIWVIGSGCRSVVESFGVGAQLSIILIACGCRHRTDGVMLSQWGCVLRYRVAGTLDRSCWNYEELFVLESARKLSRTPSEKFERAATQTCSTFCGGRNREAVATWQRQRSVTCHTQPSGTLTWCAPDG